MYLFGLLIQVIKINLFAIIIKEISDKNTIINPRPMGVKLYKYG